MRSIYIFISLPTYYTKVVITIKLKDKYTHIIQYNLEQLKQLHEAEGSTDYPELKRIINNDRHFRFIGSILNYALSRQGMIYEGEASFYLSTDYLFSITDYSKKNTSNNKMHFFCFAEMWRVINKEEPTTEADYKVIEFWKDIGKKINAKQAPNIYSMPIWNEEQLQRIEKNLVQLRAKDITPSGVTYRRAKTRGFNADAVYPNIRQRNTSHIEHEAEKILNALQRLINMKGYARKQELYKEVQLNEDRRENEKRINEMWSTFLTRIKEYFYYKTPTGAERIMFELTSGGYIITPKDGGYIPKIINPFIEVKA